MTITVGGKKRQDEVDDVQSSRKRDAIIIIPGLLHEPGRALRVSSEKIAAALDRQARTGKATFLLKEGKEEQYQGNTTPATTIIRKDETGETPLIDMYEMSYEHTLTGRFKGRKPLLQTISVSYSLARTAPRLIYALGKRSKTPREKLRILTASVILALLIAYILVRREGGSIRRGSSTNWARRETQRGWRG